MGGARARLGRAHESALSRSDASPVETNGDRDPELHAPLQRGIARINVGAYQAAAPDLQRARLLAHASGRGAVLVSGLLAFDVAQPADPRRIYLDVFTE